MRSYNLLTPLAAALFLQCCTTTTASIQRPTPTTSKAIFHPDHIRANKLTNIVGGGKSKTVEVEVGGGTATVTNEIFNLVKAIVGAGVLSLPAGIAAFGNAPSATLPANALIIIIGAFSAYGFSLIGRICAATKSSSYREAWDNTVGPSTSWITAFSSTFSCFFANLAYSMILTDTFKNLLSSAGITISREKALFGVTMVILPLCLLKDLSSLAPFSLLGIMGMIYTTVAMGLRYLGGGYAVPNGEFVKDLAAQPSFGNKGIMSVLSPSSFILISMLSTSYMAHFAAPKFYTELKNNTIERLNLVVTSSFAISIGLFCVVASLGFLTFGTASDGLILNNYSNKDTLMSLSRVAVALSIVFSYPLVFVGTREGLLDLANVSAADRTNKLVDKITVLALAVVTAAALVVSDLSFVLSFAGATLGNALIYVMPALMFRSMIKKLGDDATAAQKAEVGFAMLSCLLGIIMGGLGAYMSVKSLVE